MPPATSRSSKQQPERVLSEVLLRGDPAGWLGWDPEPLQADDVLAAWKGALAPRPERDVGTTPNSPVRGATPLQLYTHFAFCRMSCRFCQYWHVLARDEAELEAYTDHLVSLVERYRGALGRVRVANAYFGGGTPTALSTAMLRRFLAAFGRAFDVAHEFTTEAHPATLSEDKLDVLAGAGINRLSMGLQSFDDEVLRHVGRTNGGAEALAATILGARQRGMLVNVDLIVGLPTQTAASFQRDVAETRSLGPDTITIYRYQPVHRLPEAPAPDMHLRRVLLPLLGRSARQGYLPFGPVSDERYSVLLVRLSRAAARYLAKNTLAGIQSLFGPAEPPRYTDIDRGDVHLLGLGPGAVSHLVGFGWYRDVTAVRDAAGRTAPRYWGTRLDGRAETRSRALLALGAGDWLDARAIADLPGGAEIAALLDAGVRRGVLRRALRWVRLAPGVTPEQASVFLRGLLPGRRLTAERASAALAFKLRKDVQPELVDIDRAHRESAA